MRICGSARDLEALAKGLAALGHVTRLPIVLLMQEGEISPRRAQRHLDDVSLGAVAHQFAVSLPAVF